MLQQVKSKLNCNKKKVWETVNGYLNKQYIETLTEEVLTDNVINQLSIMTQ